jgi:hypothetical protein
MIDASLDGYPGRTKWRELRAAGIPEREAHQWACSRKGYWRIAGSAVLHRALPNAYWANLTS